MKNELATAIGSIGTAIAAFVALIAFVVSIHFQNKESTYRESALIRQNIEQYSHQYKRLSNRLNDGSALLMGVESIAKELQNRLDSESTKDDILSYFPEDDSMNMSILILSVVGWNKSILSNELREIQENLRRDSYKFTGYISVLRWSGMLMDRIVDDAYSSVIFVKVLRSHPFKSIFRKENEKEENMRTILDNFTNLLSSSVTGYYGAAHFDLTNQIIEFNDKLVLYLNRTSNDTIVDLSKQSVTESSDTITGTIRVLLESMERALGRKETKELISLLSNIEDQLAREPDDLLDKFIRERMEQ